jgi:hypothetical protein
LEFELVSSLNFILDVAALLLWLSWRSLPHDPYVRATPATLAGTVRRAEPSRWRRWHFLAVLFGLLFFRGVFYYQIGPAISWTPKIHLGLVTLAFGGNALTTTLLFSLMSFGRTWLTFHFWIVALVLINGRSLESNSVHKLLVLQLGRLARIPLLPLLLLPIATTMLLWMGVHFFLVQSGVVGSVRSVWLLAEQGALLGVSLFFSLKTLLPVFLFVHLVSSYVYLGTSPIWDYVAETSRRILVPLNSLRIGRIDLRPLVGMILVLLLLHVLPTFLLQELDRHNLTLWPQ